MPPQLPSLVDPSITFPRSFGSALAVFAAAYVIGFLFRFIMCAIFRNTFRGAKLPAQPLGDLMIGLTLLPSLLLCIGQWDHALWRMPWSILGLLAIVIVFTWLLLPARFGNYSKNFTVLRSRKLDLFTLVSVIGWILIVIYFALLTQPASRPPVQYDVLEYHMGVVRHFFLTGQVTPIPHVFYSAQPLGTEMLYALGAMFEGTPWGLSSGWIQFGLMLLMTLLLIAHFKQMMLPSFLHPWFCLLILAHPVISRLALDRMTDLTGGLFLLYGLTCLFWDQTEAGESASSNLKLQFFFAGMMAWAAIATKWTNLGTTALVLVSLAMLESSRRLPKLFRGRDSVLRHLNMFWIPIFLTLVPWLFWLGAHASNPIAPFAASFFRAPSWTMEQLNFLLQTHGWVGPLEPLYWANLYRRLSSLSLGPPVGLICFCLGLVIWRGSYNGSAEGRPMSASVRADIARACALLITSAIAILLWGRLTFAQDRFLTSVFLAHIVALALLIKVMLKISPRSVGLTGLMLLLVLPYLAFAMGPLKTFLHLRSLSNEEYLTKVLGGTADFFRVLNDMDPNGYPLLIGEARSYYLHNDVTVASVFDRHPILDSVTQASSAEEIRANLVLRGRYSDLIVNEYEVARLLSFHPPPALLKEATFMELRGKGPSAYAEIAREYQGYVEFGTGSISEEKRKLYVEFLKEMRAHAIVRSPRSGEFPSFWIAPLGTIHPSQP